MTTTGGGSSYTYIYSRGSPWGETVRFDAYESQGNDDEYQLFNKINLVFDFLTVGILFICFIWANTIRQPRFLPKALPLKSLVGSILCFFLFTLLNIIYGFFKVLQTTVLRSFIAIFMIQQVLYVITFILAFYIFHELIQRYLERIPNGGRKYRIVYHVHSFILGFLTVLSLVDCICWIAALILEVENNNGNTKVVHDYYQLSCVRTVLYWLTSLDILFWTIFTALKSGAHRFNGRSGSIPLLLAALFFFTINFAVMIMQIRYYILPYTPPLYLSAAQSIVELICATIIYTGIILCCQHWKRAEISAPQLTKEIDFQPAGPRFSNPPILTIPVTEQPPVNYYLSMGDTPKRNSRFF